MTEFGNYLAAIMKSRGDDAQGFARQLAIDPGTLSRYLSGERRTCRLDTLAQICQKASKDKATQAHLLAAYLRDQRCGPAKDMVDVVVSDGKSPNVMEQPEDYGNLSALFLSLKLDERFSKEAAFLAKAYAKSKTFRNAFHSLAELARELNE